MRQYRPARSYRVLVRLLRLGCHLLVALALAVVLRLGRGRLPAEAAARWWSARQLSILALRCEVEGEPDPRARFFVANHVSWLDVPLLAARHPLCFVAKAEVREWPLLGFVTAAVGTFFIRRGSGDSAQVAEALAAHLRQGGAIAVFPEGTTTAGQSVQRFHARLFHAAVAADVPIQPLAIRYGRAQDGSDIAPFIGEAGLLDHLWRLMGEPDLEVRLRYCPSQLPEQRAPGELAVRTRDAVVAGLRGWTDADDTLDAIVTSPVTVNQTVARLPG